MTTNISSGLAALSVLSGTNSFDTYASGTTVESRAVRLAKAQFTAPATTPPWKKPAPAAPPTQQLAAIRRLPTIIDPPDAGDGSPAQRDIQTSIIAYKALDRLRLVAEGAAAKTTTTADRAALAAVFAKGLGDLRTFLGEAPSDRVTIAFAEPTRRADSTTLVARDSGKYVGKRVAAARSDPLAGLTGAEQFRITLTRPRSSDTVVVDLSATPQPPTLDSVATAVNAAIGAIPQLDANGDVLLDKTGAVVSKWQARFAVDSSAGKWGLTLTAPNVNEQVSIDQIGAGDALVVATGLTADGTAPGTRVLRVDDPTGDLDPQLLGTIAAVDRTATAAAALLPPKPAAKGTTVPTPSSIAAPATAQAIVTDASGSSFVVGTTRGDIGTDLGRGADDLFLTKFDSEGGVVWQRSLGAQGSARGAAISLAPGGDIVVAGTVDGNFDGAGTDGDLLVARFDTAGDEKFARVVRSLGADTATAVAVGADGTIYLGGRAATDSGDGFLARLDGSGTLLERRTIDGGGSDGVRALAIGGDGALLALVNQSGTSSLRRLAAGSLATETGSVVLGVADARAVAVAADGSIAVAGSTTGALNGTEVNARGAGRDGFVTRIDAALTGGATTYVATAGTDEVDSLAFLGDALYVGGRTTGDLDGARRGATDGFVARVDRASGEIGHQRQFGQPAATAAPVLIAGAAGGDTVLAALGLHRGLLNEAGSTRLVAQTSLRAGDEFALRIGDGAVKKVVIAADDTLTTLAARVAAISGGKVKISAASVGAGKVLRFQAAAGVAIDLIAGPADKDALARLGLPASRLTVPTLPAANAPKVSPGGAFGLDLVDGLNVAAVKDATVALARIKSAITTTQSAYRSLYWDSGKEALTNGYAGANKAVSAAQAAQLASYKTALARLTPAAGTTLADTYTGF